MDVRAMTVQPTPDEITQRLVEMRSVLRQDANKLASEVRKCVDWRNHFRAHPWLYCGGAAAIGFLLVPLRQRPLRVVVSIVSEAGDNKKIELRSVERAQERTILKSVLTFGVTALVQESLGYLIKYVRLDRC
jgi:hypothetical protein